MATITQAPTTADISPRTKQLSPHCDPNLPRQCLCVRKEQIIGGEDTAKPRASADQTGALAVRPGSTQNISGGDVKRCIPHRLQQPAGAYKIGEGPGVKQNGRPRNGGGAVCHAFEQQRRLT